MSLRLCISVVIEKNINISLHICLYVFSSPLKSSTGSRLLRNCIFKIY